MPLAAHHKKHLVRALAALVVVIAFASAGVYWQFMREVVPVANCEVTEGATAYPGGVTGNPCP
jgi:hypothetical protein